MVGIIHVSDAVGVDVDVVDVGGVVNGEKSEGGRNCLFSKPAKNLFIWSLPY